MADGAPSSALEDALGHRFSRRDLIEEALTHASAALSGRRPSLERLEFLGDRVLALVIAERLLDRFPDEDQGDLAQRHARLVSHDSLVRVAAELPLAEALRVQPGVADAAGALPPSILEDALEAVIGAIYLDGGIEVARRVIESRWTALLTESPPRDSKTELQEWVQARGMKLPVYEIVAAKGPPHAPLFTVEAVIEGFAPTRADGRSKRAAERAAASLLLERAKEGHG